jgi:hypothetical protein
MKWPLVKDEASHKVRVSTKISSGNDKDEDNRVGSVLKWGTRERDRRDETEPLELFILY